ncbi:MAG TPA: manganese efflux pump MntP family protein [Acidobacteriota bacterium]|nr:manganese efflux pump MntP family protein [Acidobacteriota bacterium]
MDFLVVLGMAVALAMDCFAVAMGMSCGATRLTGRQTLRVAFFFGLFQFAMPVLGWFAGETVLRYVERFDHWVALALLAFVGGKMIRESFEKGEGKDSNPIDRTRGVPLMVLSVATSIDALAVGLSLAVLRTNIFLPAALIGVVCFALTVAGAKLGPIVGRAVGKRAELLGGLILIGIGVKIVLEHL